MAWSGGPFTPFGGVKLAVMLVAFLAPSGGLGVALIGTLSLQPDPRRPDAGDQDPRRLRRATAPFISCTECAASSCRR